MIIQYPNDILTTPSPLFHLDDLQGIRETARALSLAYQGLSSKQKVGLAAPQIGLNKHAAIVLGELMINLEFRGAEQTDKGSEGCYSVKSATEFYPVWRPKYGWAKWVDPFTFEAKEEKLTGLKARVYQHELDHLNGKLCHGNN